MNWKPQLNSYQQMPHTHFHRFNHLKDLLRFSYKVIKDKKRSCKTFNLYKNLLKF